MEFVRGRGRNKCFWTEEETILLIQVLQDVARDPSWTWPGGFKINYISEVHRRMVSKMPTFTKQPTPHIESKVKWLKTKFFVINDIVKHIGCQWNEVEKKIICEREWYESYCRTHREAKGLWDFRFPYYDQLALVYRRGLAPNAAVEARGDYNNNMEAVVLESKMESGIEDLGESDDSYSGDEENGVHLVSQPSPTTLNNVNEALVATKHNATPDIEDGVAKRSKTTPSSLGRRREKCYWTEEETIVLIQVLQDLARNPSWTSPCGFKSNYIREVHRRMVSILPTFTKQPSPHIESRVKWLKTKFLVISDMVKLIGCQWDEVEKTIICEREWYESYCQTHNEAKGLWDFRFPYYEQLALVYRRSLAPNGADEARGDYINNMEAVVLESKLESESEDLGESDDSYSDDEENGVHLVSHSSPTATAFNDANKRLVATKRNATPDIEDGIAKRSKTTPSPLDIGARLDEMNTSFQAFVEGFNANFATMTKFMTNDNIRQKSDSVKLKDVVDELMKLNLSSDDVFKAAEIFATTKNKMDVFLSLPEKLRVSYVIKAFNASFESMTNTVTNAATEDNAREKMASEKLKEVIVEIMKLNLANEDIFKAADMFAAERNRIAVFFGLPEELQAAYVSRLTGSSLTK